MSSLVTITFNRESMLQTLVHHERMFNEAVATHDIDLVVAEGIYLQAIEDTIVALAGISEARTLFRNARAVVESDSKFSPANDA